MINSRARGREEKTMNVTVRKMFPKELLEFNASLSLFGETPVGIPA